MVASGSWNLGKVIVSTSRMKKRSDQRLPQQLQKKKCSQYTSATMFLIICIIVTSRVDAIRERKSNQTNENKSVSCHVSFMSSAIHYVKRAHQSESHLEGNFAVRQEKVKLYKRKTRF